MRYFNVELFVFKPDNFFFIFFYFQLVLVLPFSLFFFIILLLFPEFFELAVFELFLLLPVNSENKPQGQQSISPISPPPSVPRRSDLKGVTSRCVLVASIVPALH